MISRVDLMESMISVQKAPLKPQQKIDLIQNNSSLIGKCPVFSVLAVIFEWDLIAALEK